MTVSKAEQTTGQMQEGFMGKVKLLPAHQQARERLSQECKRSTTERRGAGFGELQIPLLVGAARSGVWLACARLLIGRICGS